MTLPIDYDERKGLPLWTFLMEYFPLTFLELVRISVAGDKQHLNNSEPGKIRWAREKSTDQLNTALRHQFDYGRGMKRDIDGRSHLGKAIWRLCAQSEIDLEAEAAAPVPLAIAVPRCMENAFGNGTQCRLLHGHAGYCKAAPSICPDCGVDLEEGLHAPTCLRLNRQHY